MPDYEQSVPKLPWKAIAGTFDPLLIAFPNLLEREPAPWVRAVDGAPHIVLGLTHLAINTYRTIQFIAATEHGDPNHRLSYSISIPALSRTILEGVFSLVYFLDDLPKRTRLYYRGAWPALLEEHTRHVAAYGTRPEWAEWLKKQEEVLRELERLAPISAEEKAAPSRVPRWPTPGKILKDKAVSTDTARFLTHLYDWFYRDLSQAAHLTFPALSELAGYFLLQPDPRLDPALDKKRSDWFVTSLVLLLCHLSELELAFRYGRAQKLSYCWSLLSKDFVLAAEVFDRRYRAPFNAP